MLLRLLLYAGFAINVYSPSGKNDDPEVGVIDKTELKPPKESKKKVTASEATMF